MIHVDQQPDLIQRFFGGVSVIPAIALLDDDGNQLFRAEGRVSEPLAERLIEAAATGRFNLQEFSEHAASADIVFYRTYARRTESGQRETYLEAIHRVVGDIAELGKLTDRERRLVLGQALKQHALPSGRWMWVGGTDWIKQRANFSGAYNCTSTDVNDVQAFGLMMELAMMGSGTGAILEDQLVDQLPPVAVELNITKVVPVGEEGGEADTAIVGLEGSGKVRLVVGDSRQGWVDAYQYLIDTATDAQLATDLEEAGHKRLNIVLDLSNIRPAGKRLKGFGGTANPVKLAEMYQKVAKLLAGAKGRKLTPIECCLLIDEAAAAVVAGNIRRSAGMRQFSWDNQEAANAKDNLYTQDKQGNWKVDPVRENLRMANHTRCAHVKPSLEDVRASVTKQFYSGEGAIQYVPEAVARSNADLIDNADDKATFIELYEEGHGRDFLCALIDLERPDMDKTEKDYELGHRMGRYGLNPCGEILGQDFHCNLAEVHLNTIDPRDIDAQTLAFRAAALQVAALLHHQFVHDRYSYSREIDPIVGVSFTGLFDFFVHSFGEPWLAWMMKGRDESSPQGRTFVSLEAQFLSHWRGIVSSTVGEYCRKHGLRVPNRTTTVQPAGTKSLLTGASSGWHPPKAQRFIRRITVGANDPVALAALDCGYSVIPAQSARDEEGNLLDDIYDPRSTEWLIEVPTEVSWANVQGCDRWDLSQLSAAAQFGLYMQVQNHYTEHNTSATIEFREHEIEELSNLIHESMGNGYISAALLARFDDNATFPRLPFEPIDKATYERLHAERLERCKCSTFHTALAKYDRSDIELSTESACTSAACIANAERAEREGLVTGEA
ncbi:ribonucleoside-triphosphate reductase, adenosylcobalamin-dependent [Vulcanococcus sp.]|uniref:ribonucleoside-triphosphate reductase, adenosylcobalamin-dependent n=1 Tax=Vulcanococcus sp. TaxID=2856995 RepID=UPI003C039340